MEVYHQNNEAPVESFFSEFIRQVKVNQDPEMSEKRGRIKSNTDDHVNMFENMSQLSEICFDGGIPEFGVPSLFLPVNKRRIFELETKQQQQQLLATSVPKGIEKIKKKDTKYKYINDVKCKKFVVELHKINNKYENETKDLYKWKTT